LEQIPIILEAHDEKSDEMKELVDDFKGDAKTCVDHAQEGFVVAPTIEKQIRSVQLCVSAYIAMKCCYEGRPKLLQQLRKHIESEVFKLLKLDRIMSDARHQLCPIEGGRALDFKKAREKRIRAVVMIVLHAESFCSTNGLDPILPKSSVVRSNTALDAHHYPVKALLQSGVFEGKNRVRDLKLLMEGGNQKFTDKELSVMAGFLGDKFEGPAIGEEERKAKVQPPPPPPVKSGSGFKFTSNDQLKEAAKKWVQDKDKAKGEYDKIEDWDVSEVTSFHELFKEAEEFNEDLSRWDVSNVTSMYCAFVECSAFNSDLSTWNTSNCTNMERMFECCEAFNSNVSRWNTSNCTTMQGMFSGCEAFNSDLSEWNTSNCTNMEGMVGGCPAFNSDLSTWNTSNCTGMVHMFNGCSAFNSDLSAWNTSKCTTMECMFHGCSAFNSDLSTWNTSNCTDMRAMFENATSFNNDLSLWDISKCINKTDMFLNATAMKASHKPKGV
jgi:surface protein